MMSNKITARSVSRLLMTLMVLASSSLAHAGFTGSVLISGKVGAKFDRESVTIDTASGPVKVPRKLISTKDEGSLAPGNPIRVEVGMLEVLKANDIAYQTLGSFDSSGTPCGVSNCHK
jgi:hypothetical protein